MNQLVVQAVREQHPGPKWRRLFWSFWPAYRRWFHTRQAPAADAEQARAELVSHLPELVPIYDRLLTLTRADEEIARFLSLYDPAPYIRGCSQAVWTDGEPALIRNYDYSPRLWEGVVLASAWRGRWVVAMSDCNWGALDGMNEAGLVVSLAFGGRRALGRGFGSPLILRYLLECCETARQAGEVLRRVPTHMAYNVTVLDREGEFLTAVLSPDRKPEIARRAVATNHQPGGNWKEYERRTSTRERERFLERLLEESGVTLDDAAERFLERPLFAADFRHARATLYTAVYRPARRLVEYRWRSRWMVQSLDAFNERSEVIRLSAPRRSSR
jgi:predicted choloylglycine hydrolase